MGKKQKRGEEKSRCTRGRSIVDVASEALKNKEPLNLEWDKKTREPIGENAAKFGSWCGVVAQKYVSINLLVWYELEEAVKKDMLSKITGAFTVPKDCEDYCLSKAAISWRSWKCRLRRAYMVNKEGVIQKSPPDLYPQITPTAWTTFIAYHTSEEFLAKSEKNKANISKKETMYTGSRGGYRKLTETALTYVKEYAEGKFKSSGTDDILGRAIGKPEHPGSVRGVSSHVGVTKVFGKSERKTTTEYVKSLDKRVIDQHILLQGLEGVGSLLWRLFVEDKELDDEDVDFLDNLKQLTKTIPNAEEEEEENDKEGGGMDE
ncbi:hypothetical protein RND81_12G079800 [Saponaria officinalis]|uniref:Transposase n=1 Tax=Saponaria officinalis TaxID=3572 RepID=A0AAW1H7W2_SAPOF